MTFVSLQMKYKLHERVERAGPGCFGVLDFTPMFAKSLVLVRAGLGRRRMVDCGDSKQAACGGVQQIQELFREQCLAKLELKAGCVDPRNTGLLRHSMHATCLNYSVNGSLLWRREPEPETSMAPLLLSFLSHAHFHRCGKWVSIDIVINIMSAIYWLGVMYFSEWASLTIQMVKNLPAKQKIRVRSLGQEDQGMTTHSCILA